MKPCACILSVLGRVSLALLLFVPSFGATVAEAHSDITALPIRIDQTIDSTKAHVGDVVAAETTQAVSMGDGKILPAGTRILGHVIMTRAFAFDPHPYAQQTPSVLALQFDRAESKGMELPLRVTLRALAGPAQSANVNLTAYSFSSEEPVTTITLIGGDHFTPGTGTVYSADHQIAGYVRKQGIYARLRAADYVHGDARLHCEATDNEQPMGIFSAGACGLFDDEGDYLATNGRSSHGVFRIESDRKNVKIRAGSFALLEIL